MSDSGWTVGLVDVSRQCHSVACENTRATIMTVNGALVAIEYGSVSNCRYITLLLRGSCILPNDFQKTG